MERQNQGLSTGQGRIEYFPCIDMAKELAMVERNAKGKQARQYSIDDDATDYPIQLKRCQKHSLIDSPDANSNNQFQVLVGLSVKSLIGFYLSLLVCQNVAADVSYLPPTYSAGNQAPPTIFVSGIINPDSLETLKKQIAKAWTDSKMQTIRTKTNSNLPTVTVRLNSPGGNLKTALKMGELLRSIEANAVIHHDEICASSCVFILAGAVTRYVEGKVGIHRPIDPNDRVSSTKEQQNRYEALGNQVKRYLTLTNTPTTLFDLMIRIPSEKVRWLSESELAEFGLSENDPYYDEARNARVAKNEGITKRQLIVLESTVRSICDGVLDFSKCVGDLLEQSR